jgi:hypothetical protein
MSEMERVECFPSKRLDLINAESKSGTSSKNTSESDHSWDDDDELLDDADIKLILETIKYRVTWLTKYIEKHDKFGGAESAKVKRTALHRLSYKIRHADD